MVVEVNRVHAVQGVAFIDGQNLSVNHFSKIEAICDSMLSSFKAFVYAGTGVGKHSSKQSDFCNNSEIFNFITVSTLKGKNSVDIKITADAVEYVFLYPNTTHFFIVTGDLDFRHLAAKLIERGRNVYNIYTQAKVPEGYSSDVNLLSIDGRSVTAEPRPERDQMPVSAASSVALENALQVGQLDMEQLSDRQQGDEIVFAPDYEEWEHHKAVDDISLNCGERNEQFRGKMDAWMDQSPLGLRAGSVYSEFKKHLGKTWKAGRPSISAQDLATEIFSYTDIVFVQDSFATGNQGWFVREGYNSDNNILTRQYMRGSCPELISISYRPRKSLLQDLLSIISFFSSSGGGSLVECEEHSRRDRDGYFSQLRATLLLLIYVEAVLPIDAEGVMTPREFLTYRLKLSQQFEISGLLSEYQKGFLYYISDDDYTIPLFLKDSLSGMLSLPNRVAGKVIPRHLAWLERVAKKKLSMEISEFQ